MTLGRKIVAIVPARSGSKRIPNKNIIQIFDKPILGHLVTKLKSFEIFDQILVSTDSKKILKMAYKYGADETHLRPVDLADDLTPAESVVRYTIKDHKLGDEDLVFCIYPYALNLKKYHLEQAIEKISSDKTIRFVITACKYSPSPLRHTFTLNSKKGIDIILFPENNQKRSQEITDVYYDPGMLYLAQSKNWLDLEKAWYDSRTDVIEVDPDKGIDVDTPEDLKKFFKNLDL